MRKTRFLFGVAAAAAMGLAFASPAYADAHITINIQDDHVPSTAKDFETKECDGPFEGLPGGNVDGWHFQLGAGGDNFTSLSLTFSTPGGDVDVFIDSDDDENPSSGPGWSGYLADAGGSGKTTHAYVFTDAGWTLIAGEATVDEAGQQERFQLSHTCPGEPGPTPTPTPEPTPSVSETPGVDESDEPEEKPSLPVTGAQVGGLIVLGVGLLGGGAALMLLRRRRDLGDLTEG